MSFGTESGNGCRILSGQDTLSPNYFTTGEAKAGEARKTGFFRLLVHFNPGLQNGFTLQCLDLRKIDEAEAGISRAKEALRSALIKETRLAQGKPLF